MYDKLVAKVHNIDTNDFVLKTKYQTDKTELQKKIPDVTDFVKNAKLTELENKIPDISNLENKIPDASSLFKKTDYIKKLLIFKINLVIIIMTNILILQRLINYLLMFLKRDQQKPI